MAFRLRTGIPQQLEHHLVIVTYKTQGSLDAGDRAENFFDLPTREVVESGLPGATSLAGRRPLPVDLTTVRFAEAGESSLMSK